MALDRWIAFVILVICVAYGYAAYFTMDQLLPPILQRSPVWPSSFPKVLAVGGILLSLAILVGLEKSPDAESEADLSFSKIREYKLGQAVALMGLMVAYALFLRPAGFLASTFLFLTVGSLILGERRFFIMIIVAAIAAGSIWWLVDSVLGIYLRPLPSILSGGR